MNIINEEYINSIIIIIDLKVGESWINSNIINIIEERFPSIKSLFYYKDEHGEIFSHHPDVFLDNQFDGTIGLEVRKHINAPKGFYDSILKAIQNENTNNK